MATRTTAKTKKSKEAPVKEKKKPAKQKATARMTREEKDALRDAKLRDEQEQAQKRRLRDEIVSFVLIGLGTFFAFALQSDKTGEVGAFFASLLKGLFGRFAFGLPYLLGLYGLLLLFKLVKPLHKKSLLLVTVLYLFACVLDAISWVKGLDFVFNGAYIKSTYLLGRTLESAGAWGMSVSMLLIKVIGVAGTWICGILICLICALLTVNVPISSSVDKARSKAEKRRSERANEPKRETTPVEAQEIMTEEIWDPNREKKRRNILSYMKDKSIFGRGEAEEAAAREQALSEEAKRLMEEEAAREAYETDSSFDEQTRQEEPAVTYGLREKPQSGVVRYGLEERTVPAGMGLESTPEPDEKTPDAMEVFAGRRRAAVETVEIPSPAAQTDKTSQPKPYRFPPMTLLDKPKSGGKDSTNLDAQARRLEETLRTFNVNAHVTQYTRGPAVTRYEVTPEMGVKVNSIKNLANDIALNMAAKSIRIEAPIPGKAAVGIEISNETINAVTLREVLEASEFKNAKAKLAIAIGKDIAGSPIIGDLTSMPHVLIAGSTNSGKSVCINSIINSIVYKYTPEQVRLVLIDPKVVELSVYNGIPHLLVPVVTDPAKAAGTLNWAIGEMMKRYQAFAEDSVRDLQSYNEQAIANLEPEKVMPRIVIIIDELADLMMAASKQVEAAIVRLTQLARAAGIHMIVATQRPSADVVTGLIKTNIPSRIAFAVTSHIDSQIILDEPGAENLLGRGDMLYRAVGMSKPVRVQGCFISDNERGRVIDFLKENAGQVTYSQEVINSLNKPYEEQSGGDDDDMDEFLEEAIEFVVHSQSCSTSMLQRKFRLGYNRAARMVDMMEQRGIVGPADGTRPRKVLMSEAEYLAAQDVPDEID